MSLISRGTEPAFPGRPAIPGRAARGRLERGVRAAGYAAVCALVLLNAQALRFRYARWHGTSWLSGLWAGEVVFLLVMAACLAGVTVVTARPSAAGAPAGPAALAVAAAAGPAMGLVLVALPAAGNPLNLPPAWLPAAHALGRGVGIPLAAAIAVVAGRTASRRTPDRGSAFPLADVRARQSVLAGLCAGVAAALLVAAAGAGVADAAHLVAHFPPALPAAQQMPVSLLAFEMGLAASAAGYLPALIVLPVLAAGLGATGGLLAESSSGRPGGGGGGPGAPAPPPDPPGGLRRDAEEDAGVPGDQRELVLA